MISVAGVAVTDHLSQDLCSTSLGVLIFFEDQHSRAFGHDDLGYTLFPDDYAGSYIEGNKLVLQLTDVSEEAQAKYKIWAAQYAGVLVFKEAEYSYNSLNDTADVISKDLKDKGYTIAEYCVSETTNRIIIRVANCTSAQTSELKRALEEAYHVPVSIEIV